MDSNARFDPPVVIPRDDHDISRNDISPNALKVLYRLHAAGFRACLVGGGVRDLLLGRKPKDFDISTDAHPEDVRHLFRNCRLIGRRFRLAHVHFGPEIIEVSTFRAARTDDDGQVLGNDNVYGTIDEDAARRDFSVNALYYDIADFSVLEYAAGLSDLQRAVLRMIGDPEVRYREDPVRMLRAARLAAKLNFRIDPDTEAPIHSMASLLREVPPARLFDESLKLFMSGHGEQSLELLRLHGLFGHVFPATERCLRGRSAQAQRQLLRSALASTDQRIESGLPVTPAFLYAALLWAPYCRQQSVLRKKRRMSTSELLQLAADMTVRDQLPHTSLPKRFGLPMRDIWLLQERFDDRRGKRPHRLLGHPRFRAAFDFLLLRAQAGEQDGLDELATWWRDFSNADAEQRVAYTSD